MPSTMLEQTLLARLFELYVHAEYGAFWPLERDLIAASHGWYLSYPTCGYHRDNTYFNTNRGVATQNEFYYKPGA